MSESFRITEPGFYPDISSADYFADPAPEPSLTQSVAKILLDRSPLHAWHAHPRLNPDYRHDDDRKFDIGNIAHAVLIGRGKEIVVLDGFDDWRKKAAQEARDEAAAVGKLAVLGKHWSRAQRMVTAAREQLELRGLDLFAEGRGQGEVCMAWCERGLWMRQLVDWLTPDMLTFADLKTTGESAAPHALGRKMIADGWPIQAAMGERGLDALHPKGAGRRRYMFVVQENTEPFALNVAEIGEAALTMGRKRLQIAVDLWHHCVETNMWQGYPSEILTPEFPGWAEKEWLDREITHAAHGRMPEENILNAG